LKQSSIPCPTQESARQKPSATSRRATLKDAHRDPIEFALMPLMLVGGLG